MMHMTVDLYNQEKKKIGDVNIPEGIFGVKWNPTLVHQVFVALTNNKRQPLAHTKGRGEVRGGGKKPWKQKHTGRSRQSSIRSPLWKGGGVTFGPRNETDYTKKVNKKMKRGALYSLLSQKLRDGEVYFIDSITLPQTKTKHIAGVLKNFLSSRESALIVPSREEKKKITLAARNIPKISTSDASTLNVLECLTYKKVLIEQKALEEMIK